MHCRLNDNYMNCFWEYLYFQLDRWIQLQNLIAGSISRNSKFCVHIAKGECNGHRNTSSLHLLKGVSTVGSPEEPIYRTPTYDPIYREGNGPQTEGIHKRQVIFEEEKVGVSLLVVCWEFSLHTQLKITEDKQVKTSIRGRMPCDIIRLFRSNLYPS